MRTVDIPIAKTNHKSHWDRIYEKSNETDLGWYERSPEPTIELFQKADISRDDNILIVGAGKSTLVDWLVDKDFSNIFVNDISEEAIKQLRDRVGHDGGSIHPVVDDLSAPEELTKLKDIKLWHDRAVLHFLTIEEDQNTYFKLIKKIVSPGGYVMIAEFSKEEVNICSGLPVVNYSVEMISEKLGWDFYLIDSFNYIHKTPSGDPRSYIYTLFRRHPADIRAFKMK